MAKIGALSAKKANKANKAKKADEQKKAQAQKRAKAEAKKKAQAQKQAKVEAARAEAQKQAKAKAQKEAKAEAKKKAQQIKERAAKNNSNVKVKVKGNQIIKTYPNGKQVVQTVNKNGKVVQKEIATGKGENKVTTTIDYKAGEKTSKTVTSGKGDNQVVTELKYDNGKKVAKTIKSSNDGVPTLKTIEYDPKTSKPIVKVVTTGEGEDTLVKKTEYKYDKNNNLKSKVAVSSDGSTKEFIYDNYQIQKDGTKTRSLKIISRDANGNERNFTEEQTLNKNDKVKEFERKNEQGNVVLKGKNSYDKNGVLDDSKTVRYDQDGTVERTHYSNYRKTNTVNQSRYDVEITTIAPDGNKEVYKGTETKSIGGKTERKEAKEDGVEEEIKMRKASDAEVKDAKAKIKSKIESEIATGDISLVSGNIKSKVLSIIEQFRDFFGIGIDIEQVQEEAMENIMSKKGKFEMKF